MIYTLSTKWYESYDPSYLEGPETDWEALCASVINEATLMAMESEEEYLCWDVVKENMIYLLEKKGYTQIYPEEFVLWGAISCGDLNRHLTEETIETIKKAQEKI